MSPGDRQNEIEQRMDDAFAAGPGSKEEQDLLSFLALHPEYHSLWRDYESIRRGMDVLQTTAAPSEMTQARIRHAARERLKTQATNKRGWRWLLSQPVIAVATILLAVGFGIYSQYLFREERKMEQALPATQKSIPEGYPQETPAKKPILREKLKQESAPPPAPEPLAPASTAKPAPAKAAAPQAPAGGAAGTGLMQPAPLEEAPKQAPKEKTFEGERASDAVAPSSEAKPATELKAQRVAPPSPYESLLFRAKEKIAAQDCPGALKLLQEAKKIQDTPELEELFKKCQPS